MMVADLIVSRHPGAVTWLREEYPDLSEGVSVQAEVTPDQIRGKVVVGNLPLHLAVLCREIIAIEFAGAPPRGLEYGAEEMRAAGARLAAYSVTGMPDGHGVLESLRLEREHQTRRPLTGGERSEIEAFDGDQTRRVEILGKTVMFFDPRWDKEVPGKIWLNRSVTAEVVAPVDPGEERQEMLDNGHPAEHHGGHFSDEGIW